MTMVLKETQTDYCWSRWLWCSSGQWHAQIGGGGGAQAGGSGGVATSKRKLGDQDDGGITQKLRT